MLVYQRVNVKESRRFFRVKPATREILGLANALFMRPRAGFLASFFHGTMGLTTGLTNVG